MKIDVEPQPGPSDFSDADKLARAGAVGIACKSLQNANEVLIGAARAVILTDTVAERDTMVAVFERALIAYLQAASAVDDAFRAVAPESLPRQFLDAKQDGAAN